MNPQAPPAPTTSTDALTALNNFNAGAKTPDQILTEQNKATGVDAAQQTLTGLRGAIANTTNLLRQVAPSIMGRTANSLVTSAQATRQIGNEQAPIQQNLADEGTQYGTATQDYGMASDKAKTAADLAYSGQKDQQSYLQNLYNVLYGKEQDAAKQAEAKREFDAQLAETAAGRKSTAAGLTDFLNNGGRNDNSTPPPQTEQQLQQASLAKFLQSQYAANPNATRAQQDNWVRLWGNQVGVPVDRPNDPGGIWAFYNKLYPYAQYNKPAPARTTPSTLTAALAPSRTSNFIGL